MPHSDFETSSTWPGRESTVATNTTPIVEERDPFDNTVPLTASRKATSRQSTLEIPPAPKRTQSPDASSLLSADDLYELRQSLSNSDASEQLTTDSEATSGLRARIQASWTSNKGLVLVLVAQVFGTLMTATTRLLEMDSEDGKGMHPFQILFVRMVITSFFSMLYMWHQKIPDFPLGAKPVRAILVARGVGGFFGVFGMYSSLQYLPLADATVLTFLAPMAACWDYGDFEPTTNVSSIVSPTSMMFIRDDATEPMVAQSTPSQRLGAVGMAMVGVFGATIAYTTIRWIGKRAHPLISVNYFAVWCTIVSTGALVFVPSIAFVLPTTPRQWILLISIGVSGFIMQFLLTAGLRYEKSSRATNMVYSQMLFALGFDKLIWGTTPGWLSIAGSGLILGSAIVVAIKKERARVPDGKRVLSEPVGRDQTTADEESVLVDGYSAEFEMSERPQ